MAENHLNQMILYIKKYKCVLVSVDVFVLLEAQDLFNGEKMDQLNAFMEYLAIIAVNSFHRKAVASHDC